MSSIRLYPVLSSSLLFVWQPTGKTAFGFSFTKRISVGRKEHRVTMLGLNARKKLQAVFLLLAITAVVYAKVTGPEPGYTSAPNDNGNCVACHDTFHTENVGPGSVTVTGEGDEGVPIGGVYEPG